ncbi:MAG: Capsular biosynthesis protein CpsI [uncultured Thiotrichaceae bacterium]|uniref:Capsular biosynthesis protein CpsI n=1 Tax=uncultured Thiotrichaceae bacterium TaxID=298394 RepID=A0A6S6TRE1_9GAMM|nr:MAG: Capsular biosynthesis protein CpsI [uncultured Thiotrichaceae bacterium]
MKVLVTGAAGFIGMHTVLRLIERGDEVTGIDNLNDYYSVQLKHDRLTKIRDTDADNLFHFIEMDIADRAAMETLFAESGFDQVINLAAQAGVRYSLDNPLAYIDSNVTGFAHILEGCRHNKIKHLVYASSSSVYGANRSMPFSVHDNVDHPLSLYAASKKSNELMAHTYSHLYDLPTTGLRFFTVYGPWGRPDMSPIKFAQAISAGKPIDVYNYGKHKRDFTYIDDIVSGIICTLDHPAAGNDSWDGENPDPSTSLAPWRVYNIGNQQPVELLDYISAIETSLGRKAEMNLLPLQPGDVVDTFADVESLTRDVGYRPSVPVKEGIEQFIRWYREYYGDTC